MSEDSFTPEEIEEIVKQARKINDPKKRESRIKRACKETKSCIEEVKSRLSSSEESPLHNKNAEDFEKEDDTISLPLNVLNALKGDEESLIGEEIGGYIIKEKLGEGGMSNVFRGEKYVDGKYENVAIKVIGKEFADKVFAKEWEKLKKIPQHQNLAKYIEKGFDEKRNSYYIVLQYIYGLSITEYCEERKIPLDKRLELFLGVCGAVSFLHNTPPKIIHNDIKPSNIIVAHYPENSYLIDFGIAKFTKNISDKLYADTKDLICTPLYASPELISNKRVSEASDIYSLGVVLYELLTGETPYDLENNEGNSWTDIVCSQPPVPPSVVVVKYNIRETSRNRNCTSEELTNFLKGIDHIILKCLEKSPNDRYDTVKELIEAIELFRKNPIPEPPKNLSRINPAEIIKSSVILFLLLLLTTAVIHFSLNLLIAHEILTTPPKNSGSDKINGAWYLSQSLLCLFFIISLVIFVLTSLKDKAFENNIARDSFHQFLKGLFAVLITWFLLYSYYYIGLSSGSMEDQDKIYKATLDFLNTCTSVAFLYLFLVMDMPSVSSEINTKRNENFRHTCIVITIIGVIIAILAGIGRFNEGFEMGTHFSGLFAAVTMLYFFGRLGSHSIMYFGKDLDSPYVNIKRWSLTLLYAYGAIQVIGPKLISLLVDSTNYFILLLFFKLCLFSILIWWLFDGTFLRYFNQAPKYLEDLHSKSNL